MGYVYLSKVRGAYGLCRPREWPSKSVDLDARVSPIAPLISQAQPC